MPDILPQPSDVKFGENFGINNSEIGEFVNYISVEVNTGKILMPVSDTESVIV